MLLWPCKCSQQIWVADCDCISFLEQPFVLTGGSRCLSSPLSWLLISHPQLCSSSPSNYPWAPFSSVSPFLRPPASGSSLSSVGFPPTVLSSHCALLCPESHVSLFLHLFLHFATAHVQVTWQERVCGRLRCWVLTYHKLYWIPVNHTGLGVWLALEFQTETFPQQFGASDSSRILVFMTINK